MSFMCNFKDDIVEVGDSFLAAHFIIAGGKKVGESIKAISNKPCIILESPEGERKIENAHLSTEDITRFIREAGYRYVGIELPNRHPQVVFKITGDIEKLKSIYERFGNGKSIPECPSRLVKQEMDFLKGVAFEKLAHYYRNVGDKEYLEKIEIK